MIRFTSYYGNDVWLVPARVLYVADGGCGSRGISTNVVLDDGRSLSLLGRAEDIQRQISEALS
jgi:hypothetical protein